MSRGKTTLIDRVGTKVSALILTYFSDSQRFLILCVCVGCLCGVVAVLFHVSIHGLFHYLWGNVNNSGKYWYLWMILMPAIGGFLVGLIIHFLAPAAAGSGIPQTKAAFYNQFGRIRLRQGITRFVVCTLSVGTGSSLGREGPTVHICAAIASWMGRTFGLAQSRVQAMVPVGVGAGVAAAFNTPLSAITFVFEELLGDFNSKALGGILLSVVIAAALSRALLGENPAFTVEAYDFVSYEWIFISPIVGVLAGFLGVAFCKLLLYSREKIRESKVPAFIRPAIAGLLVGLIGTLVYKLSGKQHHGVFSIGYHDLSTMLSGNLVLSFACLLFLGKFIASLLSYSGGASGGLFGPVLFMGGMLGGMVGLTGSFFFNWSSSEVGAIALLGMGGMFAAVIRCPITSILIMFEMTLNYEIILPLMVGNMIAYYISNRLFPISIYDALLLQDKINLRKLPGYQGAQDWRSLPVSTIATYDVSFFTDHWTVQECIEKSSNEPKHAYPIRNINRELIGIITRHELLEVGPEHRNESIGVLFDFKNRKLIKVTPEKSIRDAARVLVVEDVMQMPIVQAKNPARMIGIITLHDIARQQNAIEEQLDSNPQ
jgi:CIC family chloride channel protein